MVFVYSFRHLDLFVNLQNQTPYPTREKNKEQKEKINLWFWLGAAKKMVTEGNVGG